MGSRITINKLHEYKLVYLHGGLASQIEDTQGLIRMDKPLEDIASHFDVDVENTGEDREYIDLQYAMLDVLPTGIITKTYILENIDQLYDKIIKKSEIFAKKIISYRSIEDNGITDMVKIDKSLKGTSENPKDLLILVYSAIFKDPGCLQHYILRDNTVTQLRTDDGDELVGKSPDKKQETLNKLQFIDNDNIDIIR